MDEYQQTSKTWNKLASLYESKFMDLDLYNHTYDFFCDQLNGNEPTILEIGCGPGNITRYLLSKKPDAKVLGIDVAPNMVTLAKTNNPSAAFEVMDGREINKLSTNFNAVICGFCLPYFNEADCSKLILDCCNLLTKDGLLYVSFLEGEEHQSGLQHASTGDKVYFYYHRLDDIENILRDNDFRRLQLFKVNYKKADGITEVQTILVTKRVEPV